MNRKTLILASAVLSCLASTARAEWIQTVAAPQNVVLEESHVRVDIQDALATRTVRSVFHNPNPSQVEGVYYMTVDPSAALTNLSISIIGQRAQAELVDATQARQTYEQIVQQMRDPMLLEHAGQGLLRARVFPIPPNSRFEVQVEYQQTHAQEGGLARLAALESIPVAVGALLRSATLTADIRSQTPIRSVFSATHDVEIVRHDDRHATVSFEASGYAPRNTLALYWGVSESEIGLTALAQEDAEQGSGHFFLTLAPGIEAAARIPKDVVFVVDTSGSMAGEKIQQTRSALDHCLGQMGEGDRFDILDFSTEVRSFSELGLGRPAGLVETTDATRDRARAYVRALEARGGTALHAAVLTGLSRFAKNGAEGRLPVVVFMTDGLPTVGTRDPETIRTQARAHNEANGSARLFAFGVGQDLDIRLVDGLAADNHGARFFVAPGEDVETRISGLVDAIAAPALLDPEIRFVGNGVGEVYPGRLPDLFRGSQVQVLGRYRLTDTQDPRVILTGTVNGERREYTFPLDLGTAMRSDRVARMWAVRKVNDLIEDLRLHGENPEVVQEITTLARRYGIVTPYTSYLILEDDFRGGPGAPMADRAEFEERLRREGEAHDAAVAGDAGARQGLFARAERWQDAQNAAPQRSGGAGTVKADEAAAAEMLEAGIEISSRMRQAAGRTFYRDADGTWVESGFDPERDGKAVREVEFLGEAYFDLMRGNLRIAPCLALGEKVLLQIGGGWVRVVVR